DPARPAGGRATAQQQRFEVLRWQRVQVGKAGHVTPFPRARHLHTRHRNPLPGTGAFVVVATTATFFVVVATTATLIQGGRRVGRGRRGAGNGDGRVRTGDPGGT